MSWTEERVSLLTKLWGEGHTAAEIAEKLGGVTRNAVIGKAHRLKLSNRVSPIQQNKKVPQPKPANRNERVVKSVQKAKPTSKKVSEPVFIDRSADEQRDNLYSLMDLKPRMCRWPCGDPRDDAFGFCGDEAMPGLPYCREHAKVAYQAATRNRIFKEEKEVADVKVQLGESKKEQASGR